MKNPNNNELHWSEMMANKVNVLVYEPLERPPFGSHLEVSSLFDHVENL